MLIKIPTRNEFRECFSSKIFILLFITLSLTFTYPILINFCFKSTGLKYLKDDSFITFTGSIASIMNAISRIFAGVWVEIFGYQVAVILMAFLELVCALTFTYAAQYRSTYIIATCASFITYGSFFGIYPLVCDSIFHENGAIYYSILYSGYTVSLIFSLLFYSVFEPIIGL